MANQEHLDILKKGVKIWNAWREQHSDLHPDLSGADLSGADLSGANLSGAILVSIKLIGANLMEPISGDATSPQPISKGLISL